MVGPLRRPLYKGLCDLNSLNLNTVNPEMSHSQTWAFITKKNFQTYREGPCRPSIRERQTLLFINSCRQGLPLKLAATPNYQ